MLYQPFTQHTRSISTSISYHYTNCIKHKTSHLFLYILVFLISYQKCRLTLTANTIFTYSIPTVHLTINPFKTVYDNSVHKALITHLFICTLNCLFFIRSAGLLKQQTPQYVYTVPTVHLTVNTLMHNSQF